MLSSPARGVNARMWLRMRSGGSRVRRSRAGVPRQAPDIRQCTSSRAPATMIRRLYLAGPDVFRPDAQARGRELKALCAQAGFEGLFPLDQDVPAAITDPSEQAAWIYRANIGLIERADAVLANLDFFRGPEPDSGTCFEVGYAVAKGKPVFGYIPEHGSFAQRIRARHPQAIGADGVLDLHGWSIEEFGLPLNLMLSVPAPLVVGDAGTALAQLARWRQVHDRPR